MLIDTNILLRYILQDHETLSPQATEIILNNEVICLNEVVYEVIHVLTKVFAVERKVVANMLTDLFHKKIIHSDDTPLTIKALTIFAEIKLDFIDCLLISYRLIHDKEVKSFDKKMNNYLQRQILGK